MAAAMAAAKFISGRAPTTAPSSTRHRYRPCSLSMNGCSGSGAAGKAVEVRETRTLPAAAAPDSAVLQLKAAISAVSADPPRSSSGIIRFEVPIRERAGAIDWLHKQQHLPGCYFSGRGELPDSGNGGAGGAESLVAVAGVGAAVFFQGSEPFDLEDWRCIRRFVHRDCPLIRAYGAIRFDGRTDVSLEWKDFGSFYFVIPQVEFDELKGSSILATTIAWDNRLQWPWEKAIAGLQDTIYQISSSINKLKKEIPRTAIVDYSHVPDKGCWKTSVNKALQMINRRDTELVKVVLARCSKFVMDTPIDPIALLACLQVEGQNTYQFYIQPPDCPAFIGNTPEQLFHRNYLNISTEALAGTRGRGLSKIEDIQIGQDLLSSPKEDIEFTIVRDSIRRKLESVCYNVLLDTSKVLRMLPTVQHLSAQLSGRLWREEDEFDILSSLHPTPAVCGLPTEEARQFIEEHDMFDRGMYAGPVGWFGGKESEFAVGIRSALVGKGFPTFVYAGTGIVEGSNPSSEWEELELKTSQFTKLLHQWEPYSFYHGVKNLSSANEHLSNA